MQTYYLTSADVLLIHREMIRAHGGDDGVRDKGLLEAALLRPQTGYYTDIIEEAAALWESLVMNHAVVDGNKRVGTAAAIIFLRANGYKFDVSSDVLTDFVLGNLENETFQKDIIDAWLRTILE